MGDVLIFCESVSVINGWVTMTNLRRKKSYESSIEFIKTFNWYNNGSSDDCEKHLSAGDAPHSSNSAVEGYETIVNRTLPQTVIEKIDSFNFDQSDQLPLWSRTTKEDAITGANKKVEERNRQVLITNRLKFSYFIRCELESYLMRLFNKIPAHQRKEGWFGLKKAMDANEWIAERRKESDIDGKIQEWVESYRAVYEKKNIEFDGELLSYDAEKGEKLYSEHGTGLRGYLTYV